jgi:hypothetical protein
MLIFLVQSRAIFPRTPELVKTGLKATHYSLESRIDFSGEKLSVICRMTVTNHSEELATRVPLILYRLLRVIRVTDPDGQSIPYHQDVVSFVDLPQFQINSIEIDLPRPVKKQEKVTLVIHYEGYLLGYAELMRYIRDRVDKTFTILRDDCFAYPKLGVPSFSMYRAAGMEPSFDYELKITVPGGYVVANIGRLLEISEDGSMRTYHYVSRKKAWRIDVAIAQYRIFEDRDEDVRVFYFPQDSVGAGRVFHAMQKSKALYSSWYGALENDAGFTVVEVPSEYGSQADVAGVILQAKNFSVDEDMTGVYHEMSHQWDPVELGQTQPRLNEGLATFHQVLLLEKLDGEKGSLDRAFQRSAGRVRDAFGRNPACAEVPISRYGEENLTGLSYTKGMMFFTVFYRVAGEEEFIRVMRSFHQHFFHKGASLDDFARHIQDVSKRDLSGLVQDWIYGTQSSEWIRNEISLDDIVKHYQ